MIVDCHTHIWETPQQLGPGSEAYLQRQTGREALSADATGPAAHWAASECVDRSFVLGFVSAHLGAEVPNRLIAEYAEAHPDKIMAVAGVDPTAGDLRSRLVEAAERPAFRGVTISPAGQGFHPADSRAMPLYEYCSEKRLVVFVHQGTHFWPGAHMEYARPYLWDEVLRDFPQLPMVLSHVGHPWVDETIALLGKHPRLHADIAGLIRRPWHAYNALVKAHQFAVMDKLLFGSDFPFMSASEAIESIYRLNEVTHGTSLPGVPREALRGIVERDVPAVLGLRDEAQ